MSSWSDRARARLGKLAYFGLLALSLMAPMASDVLVPATADLAPHIGLTVQARMAYEEGQFPLRVAPWEFGGQRYAAFQFYGHLPYTLSGALHTLVFKHNAYIGLKLLVWLALLVGGLSAEALARYFGAAWHAALIAATAYVAAPYLLINLHARGALPEVMAQGLLPLTLLTLYRYMVRGGPRQLVWAALACAALLATHLITSLYNLLAAGLLGLAFSWRSPRCVRRLLRGAAVAGLATLLSLWFLLPIVEGGRYLGVASARSTSPGEWAWLTPLSGLLAPTSVPPVPRGNYNLPWQVHPAVGLPLLCGVGLALAFRLFGGLPGAHSRPRGPIGPLLLVFALGLWLAWSPFDFWSRLPHVLGLAQFPYRLLTMCMWSGALLLAAMLGALVPRAHGTLAALLGCVLTLLCAGPYFATEPTLQPDEQPLSTEAAPLRNVRDGLAYLHHKPSQGYGAGQYGPRLWTYGAERTDTLIEISAPPLNPVARQLYGDALQGRLARLENVLRLVGESRASGPTRVTLQAGGRVLAEGLVPRGAFSLVLPVSRWSGTAPVPFEARVVADADGAVDVSAVLGDAALLSTPIVVPAGQPGAYPQVARSELQGDRVVVTLASEHEHLLVLPVIFTPGLLDLRMDKQPHAYAAFSRMGATLTYVRVPAGQHVVSARLAGSRLGNLVSPLTFAGLVGFGVLDLLRRRVRRRAVAHP